MVKDGDNDDELKLIQWTWYFYMFIHVNTMKIVEHEQNFKCNIYLWFRLVSNEWNEKKNYNF